MSPDAVLRALLVIRYSPRAKRPFPISWIARQAGYTHVALFRAIRIRSITPSMARNLSPTLARIQLDVVNVQQGDIASSLGRLGGGTGRIPVGRALPQGLGRPTTPSRKPRMETRKG